MDYIGSPPNTLRRTILKAATLTAVASRMPSALAQPIATFSPLTRKIALPDITGAQAIWGATGRDAAGSIWLGTSMEEKVTSGHVLQFDPVTQTVRARGNVVEEIAKFDPGKVSMSQQKLHSKFVMGADGFLYFASSDENGENESLRIPPTMGGMLWRIQPKTGKWERLHTTRDGLIAVCGGGRFIFALGYWGHNIYRFDTKTGLVRTKFMESQGSHVSRNFFADTRGHVFVPRVRVGSDGKGVGSLVELNAEFTEVASTPLTYYFGAEALNDNHGLIGAVNAPDGASYFLTHTGRLYKVAAAATGPSAITDLGWFHPSGARYTPGVFIADGGKKLVGVAQNGKTFEWVTYDLGLKKSGAASLDVKGAKGVLLYGSATMDDAGRAYLAGWEDGPKGVPRPFLLQVTS